MKDLQGPKASDRQAHKNPSERQRHALGKVRHRDRALQTSGEDALAPGGDTARLSRRLFGAGALTLPAAGLSAWLGPIQSLPAISWRRSTHSKVWLRKPRRLSPHRQWPPKWHTSGRRSLSLLYVAEPSLKTARFPLRFAEAPQNKGRLVSWCLSSLVAFKSGARHSSCPACCLTKECYPPAILIDAVHKSISDWF